MNYEEAKLKAEQYNKTLEATDHRFDNHLNIQHVNGSFLYLTHSFALTNADFYFVFTENSFGPLVFERTDIKSLLQSELTTIETMP